MKLELVPEQQGQYDKLAAFLKDDIPYFIRTKPSVCVALLKYGLFSYVHAVQHPIPDRSDQLEILWETIAWNTPPRIIVMPHTGTLDGSGDWLGYFNPDTRIIGLLKQLVIYWQNDPTNEFLTRQLANVVLHELVHYLAEIVYPGHKTYSAPGHLADFSRQAFDPLGWPRWHYIPDRVIFQHKGFTFP